MTGTRSDPIEQEIELALSPGAYIPDGICFSFVKGLDEVATKVATLIANDPSRAVTLYEAFLAACYLKIEELDDSSGSFGQFVDELYCGRVRARQAEGADPDETAGRLLAWMGEDDYGFCYRLERDLIDVFDSANLAAFVKQVRAGFDSAALTAPKDRAGSVRHHFGEILRTLYAAQKDVAAYVALAEEAGPEAEDCHAIATLLANDKPEESLAWVERGIELDRKTPHGSMAGRDLARLKRDLLARVGRGGEALDGAWADYRNYPSRYTYDDFMKFVPEAVRAEWHEKAIAEAKSAHLHAAIDLFAATGELEHVADLVHQASDQALEQLSHYTTEPVAERLENDRPDLAGRLWRAQGLRIVNAGKSRYYDAALSNFERARRCFERAGLGAEWQKTVSQVRTDHRRKIGFMAGFERLVTGKGPAAERSFMEQAKARFRARQRRAR